MRFFLKNILGIRAFLISIAILVAGLVWVAQSVMAEDQLHAEIININYHYQVAFTDIGSERIELGDQVVVQTSKGDVYMTVDDVTSVLARLIPSQKPGFQTSDEDFKNIVIGNPVTKIISRVAQVSLHQAEQKVLVQADELLRCQDETDRLNKALELKDKKIGDLQKDNKVLREQVSRNMLDEYVNQRDSEKYKIERDQLKKTVNILEDKLNKMRIILEKSLSIK